MVGARTIVCLPCSSTGVVKCLWSVESLSLGSSYLWQSSRSDICIDLLQVASTATMKVIAAIAALLLVVYVTGMYCKLLQTGSVSPLSVGSLGSCVEGPRW